MADKDTRVTRERIGGRGEDAITGRNENDQVGGFAGTTGAGTGSTAGTGSSNIGVSRAGSAGSRSASTSREETPDAKTREIRREIEQTREDLSETVNAIQDRLSPSTIASNAADTVKHAARERVRDVADSEPVHYVRANPVPTAMIGIGLAGLAWLAFGGRESDHRYQRPRYRSGSRDWRVAPGSGERDEYFRRTGGYSGAYGSNYGSSDYESTGYESSGVESGAFETSGQNTGAYGTSNVYGSQYAERNYGENVSSRAGGMASDVTRRAKQSTQRAQSAVQRSWNDSPLLIGAAAAVLGAIVGAAVPETDRENEMMGQARDNMIEGVQQAVKDKVEEVQSAATSAVQKVQDAVGITTGESSTNQASDTGSTPDTGRTPKAGRTPDIGRS